MALTKEQIIQLRQKYNIGTPTDSRFGSSNPQLESRLSRLRKAAGVKEEPLVEKKGLIQKFAEPISNFFFNKTGEVVGTRLLKGVGGVMDLASGGKSKMGRKLLDLKEPTPLDAGLAALEIIPGGGKLGKMAVSGAGKIIKTPFTIIAEKLYQSGFKPSVTLGKEVIKDTVKTGIKEGIWLTQGGVEKIAQKIDVWEDTLGNAINSAKEQGIKISTEGLAKYMDEARKFFQGQFDVSDAKKAIDEIYTIQKAFMKKYGKEIPIEIAQEIKVKTGQSIRKYYGRMTSAGIEATKQGVRFLKDKIVEKAPQVGEINKRLKALYEFDKVLEKSVLRAKNLNLLGIGTKIGAAVGGKKGAIIGALGQLLDAPTIKSGAAIGLDRLAGSAVKGAAGLRIPVSYIIKNLIDFLQQEDEEK